MKIVVNKCFGGFGLSDECEKALGVDAWDVDRTDPRLIEMVEKDAKWAGDRFSALKVVEIPDSATDWELDEYDGSESIIAVVDGKIIHL